MLKVIRCGLNSDEAREYIKNMHDIPKDKKVVLIVPDQYSFMAEKKMSKEFGGTGLNNKFVYTFRQMKRTFLNLGDKRYLGASGKIMLLKSILNRVIDEDSIFYASKNGRGFSENLSNLISELKRYCISPEMLFCEADKTDNKVLKNKLITIANVYSEFEKKLKDGDFLDNEDDFLRLSAELSDNGYFKDAYVVVDKFTDFSPQHIRVLSAILRSGAEVNIYLPAKTGGEIFEGSLYEYPEKTVNSLKKLCEKEGFLLEISEAEFKREMKPAILAYSENFENSTFRYEHQAHEIKLFQAKEPYSEVEAAALKICDLVREEGFKFSDIALVCGELDSYISFVEPVFREYGIPYFGDYKVSMTEHPIAVFLSSLFDILENNSFSREACMRYLRTGFSVSDHEADLIENHILKCGIKGSMWKNPKYWEIKERKVFDSITNEAKAVTNTYLEELRQKAISPVLRFYDATKGRKTVREMCEALFEFMGNVGLFDKISKMVDKLNSDGNENEALRFEQVWNFIVEITEQAVRAVGDEKINREEFSELLFSGMGGCEISIIPSVADGVLISDAARGVNDDIKALFVLGATKNTLPKLDSSEGILSDAEREELECEIAPTKKKVSAQSEFKAVELLSAPSDYLYLSCPVSDISGELFEPSQLINDLEESFLKLDKQSNLIESDELLYISSPEATIHKLLLKLSDEKNGNSLWDAVRRWYEKNGGFEEKLKLLDKVREFKRLKAALSAELAKSLYADYTSYSISRIEKYFECPFSYFLDNGLKLKERKAWEIGSTDTGTLIHWAACEYCKTVDDGVVAPEEKAANWKSLTPEMSEKIIDDIMKKAEKLLEVGEYDAEKTKNVLHRIKKALQNSVQVINLSMKNGKYTGAAYEVEFSEKEIKNADGSVKINGFIDRVDIYEDFDSGKAYIRIIDYKSGKKEYSAERVLNRVDLQLTVYALAAMDMYRAKMFPGYSGELEPVVKGVFYDKINKRAVKCDRQSAAEAKEKHITGAKLEGTVFSEEFKNGNNTYFESFDAEAMDYEIAALGESRFIKAKRKENKSELSKVSSAVESEAVKEIMLKTVRDGLITADKAIKSGDVEVSPYRKDHSKQSACIFCPYKIICAQDLEKGEYRKREKTKDEIINEALGGAGE